MLKNKIALVTGGSQGIGKAIAEKLIGAGATVAIAALDDNALKEVAAEFQSKGSFRVYGADLSEDFQTDSLLKSVVRDLGPVDILINNAGITGPTLPTHEVSVNDWDRTLDINLRTPYLLSKAVIPPMIERKTGTIINMSSIAGKMA